MGFACMAVTHSEVEMLPASYSMNGAKLATMKDQCVLELVAR